MDKLGSIIHRMNTMLGSKFLNFLRIKTQHLKRLQHVIVVDSSATHSQKNGVEGNGGSCAVLSWFCGLKSSQYLTSMRRMSR